MNDSTSINIQIKKKLRLEMKKTPVKSVILEKDLNPGGGVECVSVAKYFYNYR